jgi:hypothetical protein
MLDAVLLTTLKNLKPKLDKITGLKHSLDTTGMSISEDYTFYESDDVKEILIIKSPNPLEIHDEYGLVGEFNEHQYCVASKPKVILKSTYN